MTKKLTLDSPIIDLKGYEKLCIIMPDSDEDPIKIIVNNEVMEVAKELGLNQVLEKFSLTK